MDAAEKQCRPPSPRRRWRCDRSSYKRSLFSRIRDSQMHYLTGPETIVRRTHHRLGFVWSRTTPGWASPSSHFRQSRARARCSAARTSSPARCRIQYWLGTRSIMPLARVRGNNPTSCWGAGPKHVPPYSCMRPWDDTSQSAECRWRATSAEQRAEHIGRNPERPAQEDEARPSNDHRGKGDSKDATAVSTLGGQSQQCTNLPPAARL